MLRIVLDTNIVVSLFIRRTSISEQVLKALRTGKILLIISPAVFEEMLVVLSRPDVRKYTKMDEKQIKKFAKLLINKAFIIQPNLKLDVSRDSSDNKFIECAVAGKADYIVSGDKDLLEIKQYQGIKIIKLKDFIAQL